MAPLIKFKEFYGLSPFFRSKLQFNHLRQGKDSIESNFIKIFASDILYNAILLFIITSKIKERLNYIHKDKLLVDNAKRARQELGMS